MESSVPSPPPSRPWRVALPVSLGAALLLASLVIAAFSLRSHAGSGGTGHSPGASAPGDGYPWMSLGYVDIEGGPTKLYPVQPGRVRRIEAKENEPVKAGAPLFLLEDTIPLLKVREAEDALRGARQRLAIAEATVREADQQIAAQGEAVDIAKKDVDRARVQYEHDRTWADKGLAGDQASVKNSELLLRQAEGKVRAEQKKLAAAQAGRDKARGYVELARTDIAAKESQLAEAQNAVKECVVRAPCDGTPLRILINEGEVLGSNPRQPAIQFAPDRPLLVRAEVEQEFVNRVRKDQAVVIEDNVTGQECGRGRVVRLSLWYAPRRTAQPEVLAMQSDVRTLECLIHIESTSQTLRIGQRVRVQFTQ